MRRRRTPRPFAPALERIADSVMPETLLAEVQRVWAEVIPPVFASAQPVSERGGEVTVACGSGVLSQELDLLGPRIVEALNGALGRPAVKRLRAQASTPRNFR